MKTWYPLLLVGLIQVAVFPVSAQKILQLERYGRAKTTKFFVGDEITYRLKGEKDWNTRVIDDLEVADGLIVAVDRYIKVADIEALRHERHWAQPVGKQLFWFGTGWSFYGLVGNALDGNPNTHYRWGDAVVTGTAWGLALLLPKTMRYKRTHLGERKRLRLVDINFTQ